MYSNKVRMQIVGPVSNGWAEHSRSERLANHSNIEMRTQELDSQPTHSINTWTCDWRENFYVVMYDLIFLLNEVRVGEFLKSVGSSFQNFIELIKNEFL